MDVAEIQIKYKELFDYFIDVLSHDFEYVKIHICDYSFPDKEYIRKGFLAFLDYAIGTFWDDNFPGNDNPDQLLTELLIHEKYQDFIILVCSKIEMLLLYFLDLVLNNHDFILENPEKHLSTKAKLETDSLMLNSLITFTYVKDGNNVKFTEEILDLNFELLNYIFTKSNGGLNIRNHYLHGGTRIELNEIKRDAYIVFAIYLKMTACGHIEYHLPF